MNLNDDEMVPSKEAVALAGGVLVGFALGVVFILLGCLVKGCMP